MNPQKAVEVNEGDLLQEIEQLRSVYLQPDSMQFPDFSVLTNYHKYLESKSAKIETARNAQLSITNKLYAKIKYINQKSIDNENLIAVQSSANEKMKHLERMETQWKKGIKKLKKLHSEKGEKIEESKRRITILEQELNEKKKKLDEQKMILNEKDEKIVALGAERPEEER